MPRTVDAKPKPSLSLADVAERLNCSVHTVRRIVARGELPAYRVGARMIRFEADDVEALLRPVPTTSKSA